MIGKVPPVSPDGFKASFSKLADTAACLNSASDGLTTAINELDEVLSKLGLGVETWHRFYSSNSEDGEQYWLESIGYAKFNGKWGIGLLKEHGYENWPENSHQDRWPFNEAPRNLRIKAVPYLGALLDAMNQEAENTKKAIEKSASDVAALTSAVRPATPAMVVTVAKRGDTPLSALSKPTATK